MTDFRALCARMADELDYYRQLLMDDRRETHALAAEARTALAEPQPPADGEVAELVVREIARTLRSLATTEKQIARHYSATLLTRAADLLARLSDGPAVSVDREPASVTDQITHQLHRRATILLIRKVIDRAIRDTASVHWRVADTGEQLVRASDLLAWAEHMEKQMEQLDD